VSRNSSSAPASVSGLTVTRRGLVAGAIGVAAGGSVLANATAAQAATTTEQAAVAPAVVALTDAATIAVDASLGNDFRVTLGGNRTMANPANPTDGQQVIFQITQGAGGAKSLTWGSAYEFAAGTPPPLSTGGGQTDLLGFIYNAAMSSWLLTAFVDGFN
jgi:hypothetical protein